MVKEIISDKEERIQTMAFVEFHVTYIFLDPSATKGWNIRVDILWSNRFDIRSGCRSSFCRRFRSMLSGRSVILSNYDSSYGSSINDVTALEGGAQGFWDIRTKALVLKSFLKWGGGVKNWMTSCIKDLWKKVSIHDWSEALNTAEAASLGHKHNVNNNQWSLFVLSIKWNLKNVITTSGL